MMTEFDILKLTKQLFPTGRAWTLKINSWFERLMFALSASESRLINDIYSLLYAILPDNAYFSEQDAINWEKALGLLSNPNLTLDERKSIILRKIQFPGNVPARQHYLVIENELRKVGFDVYVHENRFGDPPQVFVPASAVYGQVNYGQVNYGSSGIGGEVIANHIDWHKDQNFNLGNAINLRATFFIGGQNFLDFANIPEIRRKEFRELVLRLKPAQTAGVLLINWN